MVKSNVIFKILTFDLKKKKFLIVDKKYLDKLLACENKMDCNLFTTLWLIRCIGEIDLSMTVKHLYN